MRTIQEPIIHRLSLAIHSHGAGLPNDLWTAWKFAPSVAVPLLLSILIYIWGVSNAWRQAGPGRGITARQWMSFVGAIAVLVLTLVSPLDSWSEDLFSAHMVQHLVLLLVAAPLLVMSDFQLALLWALPRHRAQALGGGFHRSQPLSQGWRILRNPILVWILFTAVMWLWHAPLFYEAALGSEAIHTFEHLSFLITGMLFWWVLLKHEQPDHIHFGTAVPFLFLTILQSSILGALMTFTSEPWYSFYAGRTDLWGMTPLQDQQLAGLIMWMPAGFVFTMLTIGYFAAWLRALEQRSAHSDEREVLRTRQQLKWK